VKYNPSIKGIPFRPLGMFITNILIEVNQWRIINGVFVSIGKTYRDVQFHAISSPVNLSSKIKFHKNNIL